MTLQIRTVSNLQKIKGYIETESKPFTSRDVQKHTGVNFKSVQKILKQLTDEGVVKTLGTYSRPKIYKRKTRNKAGPRLELRNLDKIKRVYECCNDNTAREISESASINLRSVRMYLDMLFASGCIEIINIVGINAKRFSKLKLEYTGIGFSDAVRIRNEKISKGENVIYRRRND